MLSGASFPIRSSSASGSSVLSSISQTTQINVHSANPSRVTDRITTSIGITLLHSTNKPTTTAMAVTQIQWQLRTTTSEMTTLPVITNPATTRLSIAMTGVYRSSGMNISEIQSFSITK